jgi:hypothetical protein
MIDIVYSLVISTDEKWLKKLKKYSKNTTINTDRYNFMGEIMISLMLLQKNTPWVRYIFIITDEQKFDISFLSNKFQNKIKFIDHKEIIPLKFLPTFNSVVIESFLWKIKNLSENFLYLNDDFFILNPVCPENFNYITYASKINALYYNNIKNEKWKYVDLNAQTIFNIYFPGSVFYVSDFHTPFILNKNICKYVYMTIYQDLKKSLSIKIRKNTKNGSVHFILICISVAISLNYVRPVLPPKNIIYQQFNEEALHNVIKNNPTYLNINSICKEDLINIKKLIIYYIKPFRDYSKYNKIKDKIKDKITNL